ncbi:hypothetical protein DE146DRAFT_770410 [Phaeosphaeria sp. MPI-PUGE-AT-0046c]|nr:hypothetical protein DE146DRAFT_770410 [Phaeosphaeria sp. MPI-PUGE-AT-0046c]
MVPGQSTCGFAPCGARLSAELVGLTPCEKCLEVPDNDIDCRLTNYNYCCRDHKEKDRHRHRTECEARGAKRSVVRAAAVITTVYKAGRKWLYFARIIQSSIDASGKYRDIDVIPSGYAGPKPSNNLDDIDMECASSFEDCIFAIVRSTPLIAWLLENISVNIREHEAHASKTRQTRVRFVYLDGTTKTSPYATWHAFLSIKLLYPGSSSSDHLVLDLSSMQYENPQKTHSAETYFKTAIKFESQNPSKKFGDLYFAKLDRLICATSYRYVPSWLIAKITTRACNHIVNIWTNYHGGRDALFSMPHLDFMQGLVHLDSWLANDLQELRAKIDEVWDHRTMDITDLAQLCSDENNQAHMEMAAVARSKWLEK